MSYYPTLVVHVDPEVILRFDLSNGQDGVLQALLVNQQPREFVECIATPKSLFQRLIMSMVIEYIIVGGIR